MGYDTYLSWDGMSEEAKASQFTGYVTCGHVGYLRATYGESILQEFYTYVLIGERTGHFDQQSIDPEAALERWKRDKNSVVTEDNERYIMEVYKFIEKAKRLADKGLNPMVECK